MEQIFAGHSKLISFETGLDLSAFPTKQILYRKPDGSTGFWTASLNGTKLEYQVTDQFNQLGLWEFMPVVVNGSTRWYGEKKIKVLVVKPVN